MPRPTFIDFSDNYDAKLIPPQKVEPRSDMCVHTPCPDGYLQWHDWAAKAQRTHRATRCPHCGLWAVWVPKTKRKPNQKEKHGCSH